MGDATSVSVVVSHLHIRVCVFKVRLTKALGCRILSSLFLSQHYLKLSVHTYGHRVLQGRDVNEDLTVQHHHFSNNF